MQKRLSPFVSADFAEQNRQNDRSVAGDQFYQLIGKGGSAEPTALPNLSAELGRLIELANLLDDLAQVASAASRHVPSPVGTVGTSHCWSYCTQRTLSWLQRPNIGFRVCRQRVCVDHFPVDSPSKLSPFEMSRKTKSLR